MIWPSTNADLLDTDPNMTRFIGGVLSVLYMGKHIIIIYFLFKFPELEKKSFFKLFVNVGTKLSRLLQLTDINLQFGK